MGWDELRGERGRGKEMMVRGGFVYFFLDSIPLPITLMGCCHNRISARHVSGLNIILVCHRS